MIFTQCAPDIQAQIHEQQVQLQAVTRVVNCYLREYAIPKQQICWQANTQSLPQVLRYSDCEFLVSVNFPALNGVLVLPTSYVSAIGKIQLADRPWLKQPGQGWKKISAQQTLQWILESAALDLDIEFNQELVEQFTNSMQIMTCFAQDEPNIASDNGFIDSEQSLLWGHAFHPTPKSRTGVSMDDLLACSPEVGASFPLYWFKVAKQLVETLGETSQRKNPLKAFREILPESEISVPTDVEETEYVFYPCHPWEVYTLLANPLVQRAIEKKCIIPVGSHGMHMYPTSSVRTLYHPNLDWFLKFSINVRLTNCVRKNAWYELDSAVKLTEILQPIREKEQLHHPVFKVMTEPFATTVNLSSVSGTKDDDSVIRARESFGVLLRENFTLSEIDLLEPRLAAGLFADDRQGHSVIATQLKRRAMQNNQSYADIATLWFERYLHCLLPGVLNYFFRHGVVFEPHLQNIVIGFDQGMPCCVWIRDLEGTKLLPELWPAEKLGQLSSKARESVYYTRQQGWQRIGYCTLVNNLSEAIFYLADGKSSLENMLWRCMKRALIQWQRTYGIQPELQALTEGGVMPSKNNFTTRLLKKADKASDYTMIPVPWSNLSWSNLS
jgi:siderophore synthetase component